MLDIINKYKLIRREFKKMITLADNVSIKRDEDNFMLFDNLSGSIYKLNELSFEVLSLCDGKNTDEEILLSITENFDVTITEAEKDFKRLIQMLSDKNYVYDNINGKGGEFYEKGL